MFTIGAPEYKKKRSGVAEASCISSCGCFLRLWRAGTVHKFRVFGHPAPSLLNRFMQWLWWIWLPFSPDAGPGFPALGRRSSVLGLLRPYGRFRQTSPKQYLIRTVIQLEKETRPSLSIPIWTGQILRFFKKFLKTFSEPIIRGPRVKGRNLLPSLPIPFRTV